MRQINWADAVAEGQAWVDGWEAAGGAAGRKGGKGGVDHAGNRNTFRKKYFCN